MRSSVRRVIFGRSAFNPRDLGASLYDMWDAENAASLTLSGAEVSAWASVVNGYSAAQGTPTARPIYSATGLNGRPVVTADGTDDELTFAGAGNFPTGATPCEIWALADQTALAVDVTTRNLVDYGPNSNTARRGIVRTAVVVNLAGAEANSGLGNSSALVPFSGIHVVRAVFSATEIRCDIDGTAGTPVGITLNTAASLRLRLFSRGGMGPSRFFQGGLNFVAVTAPLTELQASQMLAFLKTRGGVP